MFCVNLYHIMLKFLKKEKHDAKTIISKQKAWEINHEKFSQHVGVNTRDVNQLHKCWENMKCTAKTSVAKERRKTGGG